MWTDWANEASEEAFRREPQETIAKAFSELEVLFQVDPLEWSKAALVIAITAARAGVVTPETRDLVLRARAMFGMRYDILSTQDFLAARSGSGDRVKDDVLVSAATTWEQVSIVAARWLEKTRGLDSAAATKLARSIINSTRAPPLTSLTGEQRMGWLQKRHLLVGD